MRFFISALSIIALGLGLVGCPGGGGGGGGDSAPAFAVSTTAADFGVVGNAYTSTLAATGGTPPYTWANVAPALSPLGLVLDPATGVISSNPLVTTTTVNAFTVTFQVADSAGLTASNPVTLRLRPRTDRASIDTAGNAVTGSLNTESSISKTNGRFIAFSSSAPNLVPGVTGDQVYVHDRQTGQATLISQSDLGVPASPGLSTTPAISADGRYVAFVSTATNLVTGVLGQQIYRRDRIGSTTTLISQNDLGTPAASPGLSTTPAISADGRYVAFVSTATNLVTGVLGQQIYRHDTQTGLNGQNVTCSLDSAGLPGGSSSSPSITDDGRFVAFSSSAPLIPPAVATDVYVRAVP